MEEILKKLISKEDLSIEEAQHAIKLIASGTISDAQIGAFLIALTRKGVNADEMFAIASAMREFAHRIHVDEYIVDSCGTGADLSSTINVSTAAALVANSTDVKIIKQTNSSITSACGSTDFLCELGLNVAKTPHEALENFRRHNIAFVHSPFFNDFAKINNPIRQQIGIKTVFNYLGPLINPSFPNAQLLGVSAIEMCEKICIVLKRLKTDRALVVNGISPNLDEISICSKTKVYELKDGKINFYEISAKDFNMNEADIKEIQGGTPKENVKLILDIFKNNRQGAMLDIISLNAGGMIYLAGKRDNMFDSVELAKDIIKSGAVYDKVRDLQGLCLC